MLNADARQLVVNDESVDSALENFKDIQNMFVEEFDIDLTERADHFSFTGDFMWYSEGPAYSTLSNKISSPVIDEISRIMGYEMSSFQVNAAIKGLQVNSNNWYDMLIRPSYERDDAYIIRVVIRNPDREVIDKLISEFMGKISDVMGYIEE